MYLIRVSLIILSSPALLPQFSHQEPACYLKFVHFQIRLNHHQTFYILFLYLQNRIQVYKNNPNKKCDFDDYSLEWQNFLLERKNKDYSTETYLKSIIKKKTDEKNYNEKLSLIQKQIENLKFEKSLTISRTNTIITNAKRHLSEKEVKELDKQANESTKNL